MENIIGKWLMKKDPIYASVSSGRITKVIDGVIYYYNANAFDGFGAEFNVKADDPFVTIN